jgi:hypothetical protein
MPRATNNDNTLNDGSLAYLDYSAQGGGLCTIYTPCGNICLKILPEISDSKGANYISDTAPGRTMPLTTYAYSEPRTISTDLHFMITKFADIQENLQSLRIIQNLVYPGPSSSIAPFTPPPVVKFVCGNLMDGPNGLCLILKNYSVRYPTDVAWDIVTFLPYRFTISCSWEVVYACQDLPTNKCIMPGSNVFFPVKGGGYETDNISQGNAFYIKGG